MKLTTEHPTPAPDIRRKIGLTKQNTFGWTGIFDPRTQPRSVHPSQVNADDNATRTNENPPLVRQALGWHKPAMATTVKDESQKEFVPPPRIATSGLASSDLDTFDLYTDPAPRSGLDLGPVPL